jgi:flotillin
MTREKLGFLLPVVFTVGPDVNQRGAVGQVPRDTGHVENNPEDRDDALMKYAMFLADAEKGSKGASKGQHIENIVKGIIEGETRVLVSKCLPFPFRSYFARFPRCNIFISLLWDSKY